MKTCVLTAVLTLLLSAGFGQTKPPVLLGIDVFKPVLSLATPNRPAYQLVEATIKIPLATRYLSVAGGYGQVRSDTIYRNVLLDTQGYYLKVGIENRLPAGKGRILGWNGLLATVDETGTYSFRGPTFGDYRAPTPERRRVAIGIEGILGDQFVLSQRLLLRLSGRATIAALAGPNDSRLNPHFVPGIGLVAGKSLVYSVGLGLHLFYQIPSGPTATSSNDKNSKPR